MAIRAASTRRITASSAQSGDAVVIYSGTTGGYTVGGSASSSVSTGGGGGTTISTVVYTDQNYNTLTANAASTTFGYVRILGSGFNTGANVFLSNTSTNVLSNITANTTFINSGEIRANVPSTSVGNYTLYVFNSSGSSAIYYSGIAFEPYPLWSTPSSLTSANVSVSIPLAGYVTSTSGVQPITFGLASGNTLPSGLTLSSNGIISGSTTVVGVSQTFYLYITATDLYNETTTSGNIALTISSSDPQFNLTTMLLNAETPTTSLFSEASTNNTSITATGSPQPTFITPYLGDGYYSNSFNGSTDYLSIPSGTFVFGTNNFTVECWVYTTAYGTSGEVIIDNWEGSPTYTANQWQLWITSTGTIQFAYATSTSSATQIGTGTVPLNQWTHIAAVRNGSTLTLYLNGVAAGSASLSITSVGVSGTSSIGKQTTSASGYFYFTGYISNARVVNGTAVYTSNFTPSTTPLTAIANTVLLTCQSQSFVDKSVINNAIATSGTPKIKIATPFAPPTSTTVGTSYSTYFDGSSGYLTLGTPSALQVGSNNFTIEAWIYPTGTGPMQILGNLNNGLGTGSYWFVVNATYSGGSLFQLGYSSSGTGYNIQVGTGTLTTNTWHHVALTRSGSNIYFFLDGTQVGATNTSIGSRVIDSNTNTFYISLASGSYLINGYLSNLRLVNGTAIYTANFTPSTSSLTSVANTALLTCQGNTVIDASTNALTITPSGNVKVVNNTYPFTQTTATVSNLNALGATYFPTTSDYALLYMGSTQAFGAGDFTVECWVYNTASAHNISMAATNTTTWELLTYGSQLYWHENGSNLGGGGYGTVALNTWSHFAVSRASGTIRMFINGVEVYSASNTYNYSNNTTARYIGPAGGGTAGHYVADFRVVNGTALYTSNFAPPYQPLTPVANTSLLSLQYNGSSNNGGIVDNSEFQNVITRVNTPSLGTFSPYSQMGWSNLFNGSTDYLSIANNAAFNFGTGDFTIEMWFNIAGDSPLDGGSQKNAVLFSNLNASGSITGLTAILFGSSSVTGTGIGLYYFVSNTGYTYGFSGTAFTKNVWYHLAFSMTGGTIKTYINGTLQDTETPTQNVTSTNAFLIGASAQTSYQRFFNGYISNFRVVKGTGLYTSAFTPSTSPLTAVANTQLLTCQSNRFKDSSTNNLTLTPSGTPSTQAFTPFPAYVTYSPTANGGSCYFNGTTDYLTIPTTGNPLDWPASANYTIEAWVYPTSFVGQAGILSRRSATGVSTDWTFYYTSSAVVLYNYNGGTTITASSTLTLNTWNHVALSISGGTGRIFINGTLVCTPTSLSASSTGQASTYVVGEQNGTSNMIAGYFSDLRVTFAALYTSTFTPPTAPLTSYSTASPSSLLLNFNNGGIVDQHASFDFVTLGNVQTSTSTVKFGNKSLQFTGTSGAYLQSFQSLPALTWWLGSYTVEYWIYANAFSQGGNSESTVIGNMTGASTTTYWSFGPISGGTVRWYYYNGSATNLTTSTTLSTGQWYHLAFVNNAGSLAIYINGTSAATGTISGTPQAGASTPLTIGSSNSVSFNGYLDDVRITKYARYTGNFTPPAGPDLTL